MNLLIHICHTLSKLRSGSFMVLALAGAHIIAACQSVPAPETPREQASDLIREAESSGTIVLVVIALVVAWMVLLGFIGRITKVKNS
jgi:hypothetical protein